MAAKKWANYTEAANSCSILCYVAAFAVAAAVAVGGNIGLFRPGEHRHNDVAAGGIGWRDNTAFHCQRGVADSRSQRRAGESDRA